MIRPVEAGDASALLVLFSVLADDPHFTPHPFDAEAAERIAGYQGRDVYLVTVKDGSAIAYGMLRGWDEGYAVPSLGIAVRPDERGRGHGRAMMLALHEAARLRGANRVRLRVHPQNAIARQLYAALGYVESGTDRGQSIMILDLPGADA
jgi:ribosomal-protein-alanine N-acetyltransferase